METKFVRKLDELGRIVLPRELRDALQLRSGDDMEIRITEHTVILTKVERENEDISREGMEILNDPLLREVLAVTAASVGVTTQEYLLRFETVLRENPQAILNLFEG